MPAADVPELCILLTVCMAIAVIGTLIGRQALEDITEDQFRVWSEKLMLLVGIILLTNGLYQWPYESLS